MKFWLAFIIGILVSLVMWSFSRKYYTRLQFFNVYKQFLVNLSTDISFLKSDISSTFKTNSNTISTSFNTIIKSYSEYLRSKNDKQLSEDINKSLFNDIDIEKIKGYFITLGHGDIDTELKNNVAMQQYIDMRIQESKDDIKKKAIVIQKLSIMLGITVFLLLI